MIDLYTWKTPNGRKVPILLEELGVPYRLHPVNIGAGEQNTPAFRALNPNGKIPVLVDHTTKPPITLFESGAILIYLADKSGRFLAPEGPQRYVALQWLMFQMAGVGPMFGQSSFFTTFAKEKVPFAIERYRNESRRILGVLEGRLTEAEYLAGEYTIADIATYPWVDAMLGKLSEPTEFASVRAWMGRVGVRPAVQRGMKVIE